MKRLIPSALVFGLTLAVLPAFAQGPISWEHNLEAAKARAKKEHKQIFMDIWAEWCGPCQRMRQDVFPAPESQAVLRDMVPLSACVQFKDGTSTENMPLVKEFSVNAFPSLFVLDENGKVVRSHVGFLPVEKFSKFLQGTLDTSKMD